MQNGTFVLRLERLRCHHESHGAGSDDVYVLISYPCKSEDGSVYRHEIRWPSSGEKKMDTGDNEYMDINIDVSVDDMPEDQDYVSITVRDKDKHDDDTLASMRIDRHDPPEGSKRDQGYEGADYEIYYRAITNPIPTLRVLGVYCNKESLGINMSLVDAITDVAEVCCEDAARALKKSPRPRAKLAAEGFEAATKVLQAIDGFIEWVAEHVDNPDDFYMKHVESSRSVEGGFFPPSGDYHEMSQDDTLVFEEDASYGEYYRFPLDRGSVRIQLREYDPHKGDISLGSLTITSDDYERLKDEGAQIEIANEFSEGDPNTNREGEGAVYQLLYSVGMEDWAKPATAEGQGDDYSLSTTE